MKSNKTYLVTGGSRSGKSRHALELANFAKKPFYIATARAGDEEMVDRISKHRKERGEQWKTFEEEIDISDAIIQAEGLGSDCIVVDCLTLWTSNILFDEKHNIEEELDNVINCIQKITTPLVFVTNEVGSGIVPNNPVSREFRDAAGIVNQKIAAAVDSVILCVSGIPVKIK